MKTAVRGGSKQAERSNNTVGSPGPGQEHCQRQKEACLLMQLRVLSGSAAVTATGTLRQPKGPGQRIGTARGHKGAVVDRPT